MHFDWGQRNIPATLSLGGLASAVAAPRFGALRARARGAGAAGAALARGLGAAVRGRAARGLALARRARAGRALARGLVLASVAPARHRGGSPPSPPSQAPPPGCG